MLTIGTKLCKQNSAAREVWRYLPPLAASGAEQMALDLWLFAQCCRGQSRPVLRCYTWQPPALSLGYHQRCYLATWEQLVWQGQRVDLVRRPTGGRAVLHAGDLTYAIAHPHLLGSRQQVYEHLCALLLDGWRSLGIELRYGTAGRGYAQQANCFALATGADLVTAAGCKAIGSAQRRRGAAVLQHGSMRLSGSGGLYERVFREPEPPPLGVAPEVAIAALRQACEERFAADLVEEPLSPAEAAAVQAIAAQFRAGQVPSLRSLGVA